MNEIFDKYDTDKGSKYHNYVRQYEKILNEYTTENINYLEIGVLNGGSINAMREYFPNALNIVGLDINETCKKYENKEKKIYVEIGDATDSKFLTNIIDKFGSFDIIIDDGSHKNSDIIKTFEILFPLLNDGGVYIIEDTVLYNDGYYIDNYYPNHLQYFFQFTPFLNQCTDPFKFKKKSSNIFEISIDKIEYGCSFICVHKKIRNEWI